MPTNKPRITFTIDEHILSQIELFKDNYHCKNLSQAILTLLTKGLDTYNSLFPLSNDAIAIGKGFDELSEEGKKLVRCFMYLVQQAHKKY